jgi:hypothetical protein
MATKQATAAESIRGYIEGLPAGEPFTTADVIRFGTRAAVDQNLTRMVRNGSIERIARGVFVRPVINEYVGKVSPEPTKIAKAVAQSSGSAIKVHGAEAARQFQLSTQTPMQSVYWTSGPNREIKVGKTRILLRHAGSKKLALAGTPAGTALAALWYLGKEQVTPAVIEQIKSRLPESEFEALRSETRSMPAWLSDAFIRFERESVTTA